MGRCSGGNVYTVQDSNVRYEVVLCDEFDFTGNSEVDVQRFFRLFLRFLYASNFYSKHQQFVVSLVTEPPLPQTFLVSLYSLASRREYFDLYEHERVVSFMVQTCENILVELSSVKVALITEEFAGKTLLQFIEDHATTQIGIGLFKHIAFQMIKAVREVHLSDVPLFESHPFSVHGSIVLDSFRIRESDSYVKLCTNVLCDESTDGSNYPRSDTVDSSEDPYSGNCPTAVSDIYSLAVALERLSEIVDWTGLAAEKGQFNDVLRALQGADVAKVPLRIHRTLKNSENFPFLAGICTYGLKAEKNETNDVIENYRLAKIPRESVFWAFVELSQQGTLENVDDAMDAFRRCFMDGCC